MIDLLTITNDPELAARCDQMEGMRVFVDLERNGKAERQAGRNTFISTHQVDDVGRVKAVLKRSRLMVRVNPYQLDNPGAIRAEIEEVLAQGADLLMLPMFTGAWQLQSFSEMVDGRAPIVPLLETAGALESLYEWLDMPGLYEVFIGLNDLHLSLGCNFMFEPLLQGHVDRVATAAKERGLRMGFGGVARIDEGLLPGRDVLGEHVRLGSRAVILSRTFNRPDGEQSFEEAVNALRKTEAELMLRTASQAESDRVRVAGLIGVLAQGMKAVA
ncbi:MULTISPECIES: aldolase/citrate lyase family protein [Polaromonas]|uniref:Aldolase/citrate lyase family protein n=1 Tax=Polaromonas aquatica TaxID=332657 RepID=A0ABW1U634_9BURK